MSRTIRECMRCHRLEYATEGRLDHMTQPDGGICGGRFRRTERAELEQVQTDRLYQKYATKRVKK